MKKNSKFKKGQKVWILDREYATISKIYFHPLSWVFMYSFKEKGSLSLGELHLRESPESEKLTISDVVHTDNNSIIGCALDDFLATGEECISGIRNCATNLDFIFFRPNDKFVQWLVDYANGRIIIDVGCGTAMLTSRLIDKGAKAFGIDPMIDYQHLTKLNAMRIENGKGLVNVFAKSVENCKKIIEPLSKNGLMLIARPCHSNFVENAISISNGMEVLYITIPENLQMYNDLGEYRNLAIKINHDGESADNEIVLSIKNTRK